MKCEIITGSKFRKDIKFMKKRGMDIAILRNAIEILAEYRELPEQYRDHELVGEYTGYRECHLQSDWLLIYKYEKGKLVLRLYRTGTNSDLF